jgi:uncharacterized protein with PhoU and TrkA domain
LLATKDVGTGNYIYNPPDDQVVRAGTVLIVMGDPAGVRSLRAVCGATTVVSNPTPGRGIASVT